MSEGLKELNDIAELLQKTLDPKCSWCKETIAALKFCAKHPDRMTVNDPLRLRFFCDGTGLHGGIIERYVSGH